MFKGLSLDQAPPFEAPLKFFIAALIFGTFGGAALFFTEDIALLHLFTLGVMSSIMIGALFQMLPVVVGVPYKNPNFLSHLVFWPFFIGITLFAIGFWWNSWYLFIAAALLLFSLGIFSAITLYNLFKAPKFSPTVTAMIASLLFFMVVILLGGHMLTSLALQKVTPFFDILATIHGSFALAGWVGLLIMGVSFQVIPMFYVTTEPNQKMAFMLLFATIFSLLLAPFFYPAFALLNALFAIYAIWMITKIFKRKRKIEEPSITLWYIALFALTLAAGISFFTKFLALKIFIAGFAISVMIAMLYKIIPFLVWLHLSAKGFFDVPTMKEMIDERLSYLQIIFHILAIIALCFTPHIGGIFFAISFILLAKILSRPIAIYFSYKKRPSPMG